MKYLPIAGAVIVTLFFFLAQCTGPRQRQPLTEAQKAEYLEKGKAIAGATFAALSSQLAKALEEGSVVHAVQYCNSVALPLTDSLSNKNNAFIRRTSFQLRNPKNAPVEWEQAVLNDFQALAQAGGDIKPVVQLLENGAVAFAAPIRMVPLCLKCHGTIGGPLTTEDYAIIQKLYPQDQAVGYVEGDLRGMWSIVW